jgi:RNA polymerase primary sigma factor
MDSLEIIKQSIKKLSPREKTVIIRRIFEGKTFQEIGKEFDVTRERIRQIESKAAEIMYKTIINLK